MIPKIVHYIWFGEKDIPELTKKCIESWKKYCPDYELRMWNEKNFDISTNQFVKEAYEAQKYAFVSDYVRLKVLYEYGGIYMDTDVEVLKSLDVFLDKQGFSGFENEKAIQTGIMGCERNFPLFGELLSYYNNKHFIKKDGSYDMVTNVTIITNMLLKKGLELNNNKQEISGFTLYPNDYFCPINYEDGLLNLTANTYTIHHFNGSWLNDEEKKELDKKRNFIIKYGKRKGEIYFKIIKYGLNPLKLFKKLTR